MSSIGDRLREERERIGLNQTKLAELAKTTRKSQFNYEINARRPDADYLSAVAAAGVDVLYILTGQRSGQKTSEPPSEYIVTRPDELALLDNYRHSSEEGQKAIKATSAAMAQSTKKVKKKTG